MELLILPVFWKQCQREPMTKLLASEPELTESLVGRPKRAANNSSPAFQVLSPDQACASVCTVCNSRECDQDTSRPAQAF